MADVPIDRIRCQVGYVSADTAKIIVVTFNDKPITATCSGGTPSVGTLTAQGTAHGGGLDHVCHTGLVTITGLTAGQRYTYSLTHEGETISGSFRTEPSAGAAWKLIMSTCEGPWLNVGGAQMWRGMRERIEADSEIVARAHIDDVWYFDTAKIQNYGTGSACPETGITQSGVPQATESEVDYVVAYAAYFGMFPEWLVWTGNEHRQWLLRNIAWWTMFGDHEFYGDARSHVAKSTSAVMGNIPAIDAFIEGASGLWNSFFGNANPPVLRASEYYWGMDFGGVTFATLDRVTHAQAYDACNSGDSGSRGASDSGWYIADVSDNADWVSVHGEAKPSFPTNPSRTDLGIATDATGADYMGANQISDLESHFTGSSEPWKVLLTSVSVTAHNQPWYDWHPTEWLGYIQTILGSDACNGTDGHYCHFLGDVHTPWVRDFTADGTADGLGGTGLASGEFWEFNAGSFGSQIGGYGRKTCQGGRMRGIIKANSTQGDINAGAWVLAEFSPSQMAVSVVRADNPALTHFGPYTLDASATDNVFSPPDSSVPLS